MDKKKRIEFKPVSELIKEKEKNAEEEKKRRAEHNARLKFIHRLGDKK